MIDKYVSLLNIALQKHSCIATITTGNFSTFFAIQNGSTVVSLIINVFIPAAAVTFTQLKNTPRIDLVDHSALKL